MFMTHKDKAFFLFEINLTLAERDRKAEMQTIILE